MTSKPAQSRVSARANVGAESKPASQFEPRPGLVLDSRRAVWFARERVLAVADLHLGYVWAQRYAGQMLPLSAPEDVLERLRTLVQTYRPDQLVVLGDIVHRALPLPAICHALEELITSLRAVCQLRFVAGNHDRALAQLFSRIGIREPLEVEVRVGEHRLVHGHDGETQFQNCDPVAASTGALTVMGHEHPALWLGDGVTAVKCPCFLLGTRVLILPAFSAWAAGSGIEHGFMSALARSETFTRAIAIMSGKLLPLPWGASWSRGPDQT